MKNLFIIKKITENKELSDQAFVVWCGLRNIMQMDKVEYFISYNMIAHSIFKRVPNRYELTAIKNGLEELLNKRMIKIETTYSKSEMVLNLTNLYYKKDDGFFADLSEDEMHKIMNLSGNFDRYKLLRYFTCQIGSFNRSEDMGKYKGKLGGMGLDYFANLISISKPTVITFNKILEENKIMFIIRHKDFFQGIAHNGSGELREIPNTYSRWCDKALAEAYSENIHGYKYNEANKNKKTERANKNRSLGQKLHYFATEMKEYSEDEIRELYAYAVDKNKRLKRDYDLNVEKGYSAAEPKYIDMSIFDEYDYLEADFQNGNTIEKTYTIEEMLDFSIASDVVA